MKVIAPLRTGIFMVHTAVILAAGLGSRLKGFGAGKPKGFIQISNTTLIERSIRLLKKQGIKKIIIVTGYASHYYENLARTDPSIILIHSDKYERSGSMYSMSLIRDEIESDFLLLESDIIYAERALTALQNTDKPNAILISQFTHSGDEVYIDTVGDRITSMSKNKYELLNITGELVGICKISIDVFRKMLATADEAFKSSLHLHYEDCFNAITENTPIYFLKLDDLHWGEIDTIEHLNRIQEQVWPAISKEERIA